MTPPDAVFDGIPMSMACTGALQRQRLVRLGLDVVDLEILRDIDDVEDLLAVAALASTGRLATVAQQLGRQLERQG